MVWARVIAQKAKTYLNGDSILKAKPLGFPGKIINTFGDSAMVFALKDKAEIPALYASLDGTLGATFFTAGVTNTAACIYGTPPSVPSLVPYLANPNLASSTYSTLWEDATQETIEDATSSMTYMANLCAFKTDVYRSVDNQELVWTGFQVVGDDINNFFFDDEKYITDLSDPTSASYGNTIVNPQFGQDWNSAVFPFATAPTVNIGGTGAGASATAVIDAAGTVTSITVNAGGAGYGNGATLYDVASISYLGNPVTFIDLTVFTGGGGNIISISAVYTPNTYKIETGECSSWCSDPTYDVMGTRLL